VVEPTYATELARTVLKEVGAGWLVRTYRGGLGGVGARGGLGRVGKFTAVAVLAAAGS